MIAQFPRERSSKGIYDRTQILARFPEIGFIFRKEKDGMVRILLFGHYRIAYFVRNDESVTIQGVFPVGRRS